MKNNPLRGTTWCNFCKQAYEIYATPLTDEAAREHIPQDGWVQELYGVAREKGQTILEAMRTVFLVLEEKTE